MVCTLLFILNGNVSKYCSMVRDLECYYRTNLLYLTKQIIKKKKQLPLLTESVIFPKSTQRAECSLQNPVKTLNLMKPIKLIPNIVNSLVPQSTVSALCLVHDIWCMFAAPPNNLSPVRSFPNPYICLVKSGRTRSVGLES